MDLERLSEEEKLDIEILYRTVNIKDHLGAGDATLPLNGKDSDEKIGKLIKRVLDHADGALISVREQ